MKTGFLAQHNSIFQKESGKEYRRVILLRVSANWIWVAVEAYPSRTVIGQNEQAINTQHTSVINVFHAIVSPQHMHMDIENELNDAFFLSDHARCGFHLYKQ